MGKYFLCMEESKIRTLIKDRLHRSFGRSINIPMHLSVLDKLVL